MENRLFLGAAIFLFFFLLSFPVSAADITIEDLSAKIDENNQATVSGNIVPAAEKQITVKIIDPGGKLEYLNQTETAADGSFSFSYTMNNKTEGTYQVTVSGEGINTPYEVELQAGEQDECFVATAAYGFKFAPGVTILRQFRDAKLLTNLPGQAFVGFYYNISPSIAEYIAGNSLLKMLVRTLLLPIIAVVYLVMHPWLLLLTALTFLLTLYYRRKIYR